MNLNDITKKMKELSTLNAGKIDAKIKFEFSDGSVLIDDTVSPPTISNDNNDADCVIEINNENFSKILNKKMNSMSAFMTGKMKIKGEMGIAMKLSSLFD
jgi:putative sterol carrier protein|tara:strand:- start:87 stop:386 length:300 start_codon:yes stop_codon:yes gene_type:complete